jgi:hypothetical protein
MVLKHFMRSVRKYTPCGLVMLLSVALSGCLFESGTPTPVSTPARVPAAATPTAAGEPSPVGDRVRYGCEDPWYLEPSSLTPKITKSEAETRIRAFLEERGPRKAVELLETHYGTWIQGEEADERPAAGTPDPGLSENHVVWLLVFKWLPQPGAEQTPPPGLGYRIHGLVDAQTGEALAGCAELMHVQP